MNTMYNCYYKNDECMHESKEGVRTTNEIARSLCNHYIPTIRTLTDEELENYMDFCGHRYDLTDMCSLIEFYRHTIHMKANLARMENNAKNGVKKAYRFRDEEFNFQYDKDGLIYSNFTGETLEELISELWEHYTKTKLYATDVGKFMEEAENEYEETNVRGLLARLYNEIVGQARLVQAVQKAESTM